MSLIKQDKQYFSKNGSLKIEKRESVKEEASDAAIDEFNDVLRHLNVLELVKFQNYKLANNSLNSSSPSLSPTSSSSLSSTNSSPIKSNKYTCALQIDRGCFKRENHFYAKVLNSKIHPVVASFYNMTNEAIITRYKQLNQHVNADILREYLNYKPKYFKWAGSDLFNVSDENGKRQMIIIETNSCPSGQKSMPLLSESQQFAGYKRLLESIFDDLITASGDIKDEQDKGDLAVVFDKNITENSAYSAVLAELSNERVWLVEYHDEEDESIRVVKWDNGYMYVKDINNVWHKIRACLRYVTQKPWKRLPLNSKTKMLNPIIVCLAGGRNKIMASYAYRVFNQMNLDRNSGIYIRLPYSLINVNKSDIPSLLDTDSRLNGKAVVKVPYGNCGQGVYTILNKHELDDFMNVNHKYDKFIIQSLIGDHSWSRHDQIEQKLDENYNENINGKNYFHIGTVPDKKNNVFVFDLRMIVTSDKNGFKPVSMNCRRARKPLTKDLTNLNNGTNNDSTNEPNTFSSWDMLGTNLSIKVDKNLWDTESERLLIMDNNDFNTLGVGIDDLIDAYIQTVLSVISIDKMCIELLESNTNNKNEFNVDLFKQLNPDESLFNEIRFN